MESIIDNNKYINISSAFESEFDLNWLFSYIQYHGNLLHKKEGFYEKHTHKNKMDVYCCFIYGIHLSTKHL